MATTTNYGWTTPDDTALVKDGAAAIRTLGSSVDTTTKNLNPSTTLGDIEYRSSTANTNTRLGIGSTGNVLTVAGGVPSWAAPGQASLPTAVFTDTKASGTASGTFTADAWRTRVINTTQFNNITSASIASNQITLPAGTYLVTAMGQVALVDVHKIRFYNITDSSVAITGTSNYNITSYQYQGTADLVGAFTIAGSKVFELQHYAKETVSSNGFGVASTISATDEVYAIVSITKVA